VIAIPSAPGMPDPADVEGWLRACGVGLPGDCFGDEAAACAELDEWLEAVNLFRVYREVRGRPFSRDPRREVRDLRIDRVLVPTHAAVALGWTLGAVGVEVKRSQRDAARGCSQAIDYAAAIFALPGVDVVLGWIFLFPLRKPAGLGAGILEHLRIGVVEREAPGVLALKTGSCTVLRRKRDGALHICPPRSGKRSGSK
jgi:hypothetical protein